MSIKNYTEILAPTETPQSAPLPGREARMQPNAAGGYAFGVSPWTLLDRFVLLGTEKPTYYTSAKKLTKTALTGVERCLLEDGGRAVRRIVEISEAGRAPKNDHAIVALALAAKCGDAPTRRAALEALPRVCRIGTHLFAFCDALQVWGGWGRATKRAVGRWYLDKEPKDLAYQITKYAQREGWSHRDVLRLAHPKPAPATQLYLQFAAKNQWLGLPGSEDEAQSYMQAVGTLHLLAATQPSATDQAAEVIRTARLPREVVPSEFLSSAVVWEALLQDMPIGAMIRNLATMTRLGLLAPFSAATRTVAERLGDGERLRRARVHPIGVLMALRTYAAGKGLRGQHTWEPVPQIVQALDDAFYLTYAAVEPAGANVLVALDVSASMGWGTVGGVDGLSPREASAAVALVMANTEPSCTTLAFSHELVPLALTKGQRLDDAVRTVSNLPFGGTNCALPMIWAREHKVPVDCFLVVTDNETWSGNTHPVRELERYREELGRPAKMVVLAMTATDCSIADPNDAGMLDCVGFDAAVPNLIADFARPAHAAP